jgi:hypothetical protein
MLKTAVAAVAMMARVALAVVVVVVAVGCLTAMQDSDNSDEGSGDLLGAGCGFSRSRGARLCGWPLLVWWSGGSRRTSYCGH